MRPTQQTRRNMKLIFLIRLGAVPLPHTFNTRLPSQSCLGHKKKRQTRESKLLSISCLCDGLAFTVYTRLEFILVTTKQNQVGESIYNIKNGYGCMVF
ncbi:hypothetical protein N665_0112s0022, partial [Sinapis alba]